MLEVHVRTDKGWLPLSCTCPAGRAVFSSEQTAAEAIERHIATCSAAPRTDLRDAFRVFAVEAMPA